MRLISKNFAWRRCSTESEHRAAVLQQIQGMQFLVRVHLAETSARYPRRMSVTAEQYQGPSNSLRMTPTKVENRARTAGAIGLVARAGSRMGLSKFARTWHNTYTRMNPWGKGGFVDQVLERMAFFD